jgi:hypothetical protein
MPRPGQKVALQDRLIAFVGTRALKGFELGDMGTAAGESHGRAPRQAPSPSPTTAVFDAIQRHGHWTDQCR